MSFLTFAMRRTFARLDDRRDAGLSAPGEIERFEDISYGPDPAWQRLDVYRPKQARGAPPVIVSVHGGGWVYGDKERYRFYCMDLARRGFAVVNFTYHLAPKYRFPQALLDTALAFRWTADNTEAYGLDGGNIFAVGDSAGGHLLALYCTLCADPEYAARLKIPAGPEPLPKAVGLNCGIYDVTGEKGIVRSLMKDVLPKGFTREDLRLISPLLHVTREFPPAYIATAAGDFLREDSVKLRDRLTELGAETRFRLFENGARSPGHVFHLNIRSDEARICNDDECAFFAGHMRKTADARPR